MPWGRGARVDVRRMWGVGVVVPMAAGGMPSPHHVLLLCCLLPGLQEGLRGREGRGGGECGDGASPSRHLRAGPRRLPGQRGGAQPRFHEAGWDAYCTGVALLRLAEEGQRHRATIEARRSAAALDDSSDDDDDGNGGGGGGGADSGGAGSGEGARGAQLPLRQLWRGLPTGKIFLMKSPYCADLRCHLPPPAPTSASVPALLPAAEGAA